MMETLVTKKVSEVLCPIMTEIAIISERIKQKAHDLFMQYGLRSVSMDDIANGLGISKKTIYQYFADKDELVDEVVNGIIRYNQSCCDEDIKNAENAVHEIFLAMEFMMEIFRSMNISCGLKRSWKRLDKRAVAWKPNAIPPELTGSARYTVSWLRK